MIKKIRECNRGHSIINLYNSRKEKAPVAERGLFPFYYSVTEIIGTIPFFQVFTR
jgi:hypothetical protein